MFFPIMVAIQTPNQVVVLSARYKQWYFLLVRCMVWLELSIYPQHRLALEAGEIYNPGILHEL
jgi:hypothetical protein